jgi:hypothetical protein
MNEGIVAAISTFVEEPDNDNQSKLLKDPNKYPDELYELPLDIALVSYLSGDPRMLDKVLQGPNTKEWQEALEYEICQLEKLETWEVVDLPQGQTAIPCSKVIRVKRGPNGETQSYRVRVVAGGHRQVEGVNYTKTFSAAAKMLTVCVVLANATHQD